MANRTKKHINKGLIVLNKGERTAVITLLSLIACLLGFSIFRPVIHLTKSERTAFHNLDSMIAVHTTPTHADTSVGPHNGERRTENGTAKPSTKRSELKRNPVGLTDRMGDKTENGKRRTENGKRRTENASFPTPHSSKAPPTTLSLNTADSTELITLPQIGEVMASRIHRYRDRLGGYVSLDQLFEVKGMTQERFETIQPFLILNSKEIRRLDVNQDEFKTLLRHPYLEYEQVKSIVNHRERKGYIRNWEEFRETVGEVNPLLESYLTY